MINLETKYNDYRLIVTQSNGLVICIPVTYQEMLDLRRSLGNVLWPETHNEIPPYARQGIEPLPGWAESADIIIDE